MQNLYQPTDIAGVKSNAGFVKNKECVHKTGPQCCGEVYSLYLSTAESAGLTIESKISQSYFVEVFQSAFNFLNDQLRCFIEITFFGERFEKRHTLAYGKLHQVMNRIGTDFPQKNLRFESRTVTIRAEVVAAVARKKYSDVHFIAFALKPFEKAFHTIPFAVFPASFTFQNPLFLRFSQFVPGLIKRYPPFAGKLLHLLLALAVAFRLPRSDCSLRKRKRRVRYHERVVDAYHPAESAAGFTSTQRRIKREEARGRNAVADIALCAVKSGREVLGGMGVTRRIGGIYTYLSASRLQRLLEVFHDSVAVIGTDCHSVLNHLYERIAFG